jgi:hypothetical protein
MDGPGQHILQISTHVTVSYSFLKDTVYRNNTHTIQKQKQEISAAMISMNEHSGWSSTKFPQTILQWFWMFSDPEQNYVCHIV